MPKGIYPRKPITDEQKEKLRIASLGRKHSTETRRKMSERLKGNKRALNCKRSEEFKKKVSESLRGRPSPLKGKKLSIEARKVRSENQKMLVAQGVHPFWRGGIYKTHQRLRGQFAYRLWREAVFKRDNYTCQFCGERGGRLNADHIKPFALFPELRLELSNGRTLCVPCHKNTDTFGHKTKPLVWNQPR